MKIVGSLDGVADGRIVGWARDEADPLGRLELFGWIDGRLAGRCLANRHHGGLAGVGDGYYGFSLPIPPALRDGRSHAVRLALADGRTIDGFATQLAFPAPPPPGTVPRPATVAALASIHPGAVAVEQWIAYHHAIGVGLFLLQGVDNAMRQRLAANQRLRGVVEIIDPGLDLPAAVRQRLVGHAEWLVVLDADEYLVPRQHAGLGDLLALHGDLPGLGVGVVQFADTGPAEPDTALVPQRFRYSNPLTNVRTIARVDRWAGLGRDGAEIDAETLFDSRRQPIDRVRRQPVATDMVQVNRYPLGPEPAGRPSTPASTSRRSALPIKLYDGAIDRHVAAMQRSIAALFPDGIPRSSEDVPVRVYLHIGLHKTGTTSIQRFLLHNREALERSGILVPLAGALPEMGGGHHRLPWSLRSDWTAERADALWAELRAEIAASGCRRVVISAEDLSTMPMESVQRVAGYLAGYEIVPVVFVRRPSDILEGAYRTTIVAGSDMDMVGFIPASGLRFRLRDVLSDWRQIATRGRMIIGSYDDPAVARDVVVTLLSWVEPHWTGDQNGSADRSNRGLPAPVIALTAQLRRQGLAPAEVRRWLAEMTAIPFARAQIEQPRFVSNAVEADLDQAYREDLAWLAADRQLAACVRSRLPSPEPRETATIDSLEDAILALAPLLAGNAAARLPGQEVPAQSLVLERLFHHPTSPRRGIVRGNIDSLKIVEGSIILDGDGPVQLHGWAMENDRSPQPSPILHIRSLDPTAAANYILQLKPGAERPDVAKAFPKAPRAVALKTGFTATLEPWVLPNGRYALTLGFSDEFGICLAPSHYRLDIR